MIGRATRVRMQIHGIELWIQHEEVFRKRPLFRTKPPPLPVTLVLRFRKSASWPTLPLAINARVFELARSDADPVTAVPLITPDPRLRPLSMSSNNPASAPDLVALKASRNPFSM